MGFCDDLCIQRLQAICLPNDEERQKPIAIPQDYYELDTAIFDLPDDYIVEAPIEAITLDTTFGYYQVQSVVEDEKIIYCRQFKLYKKTHAKETYAELRKFFRQVAKSDKGQLVLAQRKT